MAIITQPDAFSTSTQCVEHSNYQLGPTTEQAIKSLKTSTIFTNKQRLQDTNKERKMQKETEIRTFPQWCVPVIIFYSSHSVALPNPKSIVCTVEDFVI